MRRLIPSASLIALICIVAGGDALACGDKFLVAGRGTRYQRPKDARAASVLIYANRPSERMQAFLEREGHHATTVGTLDQLSAVVKSHRFDVILAAADAVSKIQELVAGVPDGAIVVTLDATPRPASLLDTIDRAVAQRDRDLSKNRTRS